MLVVAHAHVDEWKAAAALERALARVAATREIPENGWYGFSAEGIVIGFPPGTGTSRCHFAALVAYREAFDVHGRARARHSRWYRAYRRARR